jgi:mono/diheme cytochrome c family protein
MKRKSNLVLIGAGIAASTAIAGAVVVYSGVYNVAADDPHTKPVYALLETARERSIAARADDLKVPPGLNDPARIRQGAGNYSAMCAGCHLTPGAGPTEMSQGLYPAPPNLSKQQVDLASSFWVIKHGIKASGMPAWGKSMDDDYIWNMAAFLQELPKLDAAQYAALVASSDGHSHGGGETEAHGHGDGEMDDHGGAMSSAPGAHPHPPGTPSHDDSPASGSHAGMEMRSGQAAAESKPHAHGPDTAADHHGPKPSDKTASPKTATKPATGTVEHRHTDGTVESHPAPAPSPPSNEGHDDHQH